MRNSPAGFLLRWLIAILVGVLGLVLFQGLWLALIGTMLKNSESALPVSSPAVSGLSFPTRRPPASIGTELQVRDLAITVQGYVRPADSIVGAGRYNSPEQDEEYLLVEINVRCVSGGESCRLTEFDFGVSGDNGRDYAAEFSSSFDGLDGLFEGGEIESGKSLSGDLVFIVARDDTGLILSYPRMFSFGESAQFRLQH